MSEDLKSPMNVFQKNVVEKKISYVNNRLDKSFVSAWTKPPSDRDKKPVESHDVSEIVSSDLVKKLMSAKLDFNNKMTNIIQEANDVEAKKQDVQSMIDLKNEEICELSKNSKQSIEDKENSIKEFVKSVSEEQAALDIQVEEFSIEIEKIVDENNVIQKTLDSKNEEIKLYEEGYEKMVSQKENSIAENKRLIETEKSNLLESNKNHVQNIENIKSEIKSFQDVLNTKNEEVILLQAKLDKENKSVVEVNVDTFKMSKARLDGSIARFKVQLGEVLHERDFIKNKLNSKIQELELLKENHQKMLKDKQKLIDECENKIQIISEDTDMPVQEVNGEIDELKDMRKKLQEELSDKDDEIRLFNNKLVSLFSSTKEELQMTDDELDSAIETLTQDTDEIKEEREVVRAKIEEYNQKIELLNGDNVSRGLKGDGLLMEQKAKLETLKAELLTAEDSFNSQSEHFSSELEIIETLLSKSQKDVDALDDNQNSLDLKMEKLQAEHEKLNRDANADVYSSIDQINKSIAQNESDIESTLSQLQSSEYIMANLEKEHVESVRKKELMIEELTRKYNDLQIELDNDIKAYVEKTDVSKEKMEEIKMTLDQKKSELDKLNNTHKVIIAEKEIQIADRTAERNRLSEDLERFIQERHKKSEILKSESEELFTKLNVYDEKIQDIYREVSSLYSSGTKQFEIKSKDQHVGQ